VTAPAMAIPAYIAIRPISDRISPSSALASST
jgi:hypothetical protein